MSYDDNVFINCPFDPEYRPLFRAAVFTALDCGLKPRCALERDDGSEVRIDKIRRMIAESRYGIHDISRTDVDGTHGLPRFNMPLELGMFLGAKLFGAREQRAKCCVIFDREPYRYQIFCSGIAGQDIRSHGSAEDELIRGVRDAVRAWRPERQLPGAATMADRYRRFVFSLPHLTAQLRLDPAELTFYDLHALVSAWLVKNDPECCGGSPG